MDLNTLKFTGKHSVRGEKQHEGVMSMNGKIGTIGRILAICVLGVFLAQGAMAAPVQRVSKEADRALRTELKALHKQEKMAKSPEERSAIRAQMKQKKHKALVAKKAQRSAKRGVK
jgi:hypothetical protein